jgi:6-phosphogluconolactonase
MNAGDLIVCDDAGAFADVAANWIARRIEEVIRRAGRCSVALAGGSTPRPVYSLLASPPYADQIDWSAVDVFFGDERCVPPDDKASNYRMAWTALLAKVPLEPDSIHRMQGELPDRAAAARGYAELLPARLDLLILGAGSDGHTASLFPGSPLIQERSLRVAVAQSPKAPPWRLTITPPVIESAHHAVVLVRGKSKSDVVRQALRGAVDPTACPVQLAAAATWIADPAAAALVGRLR